MSKDDLKMAKKHARCMLATETHIDKWFNSKEDLLGGRKPKECELDEVLRIINKVVYKS